MNEIDLAISCLGSDKNIYCEGIRFFSKRNNIILKPKVLYKLYYETEERVLSLRFMEDLIVRHKRDPLASFGFYGSGLTARCFICQSEAKSLYDGTCLAEDSHVKNTTCPFYLDYLNHESLSSTADMSCPLCCADVKYMHHLIPCGHTVCLKCSWLNQTCPYDRLFIVGLLRANHVSQ